MSFALGIVPRVPGLCGLRAALHDLCRRTLFAMKPAACNQRRGRCRAMEHPGVTSKADDMLLKVLWIREHEPVHRHLGGPPGGGVGGVVSVRERTMRVARDAFLATKID